jgi:hypothetical protein
MLIAEAVFKRRYQENGSTPQHPGAATIGLLSEK